VKELIPEFYEPPGDFLLNIQELDLGMTQTKEKVNDAILPPWASSANDFALKMREVRSHFFLVLVFVMLCNRRWSRNTFRPICITGSI